MKAFLFRDNNNNNNGLFGIAAKAVLTQ